MKKILLFQRKITLAVEALSIMNTKKLQLCVFIKKINIRQQGFYIYTIF